jgi:hypothetical protein
VKRWILVGVATALSWVLALTFLYPDPMVSPGPLASAHVELTTDCFACHVPLRGATSDRCIVCHSVADIGLRSTKGVTLIKPAVKTSFHQQLAEDNCIACHSEHQGVQFNQHGQKTFSHELLRASARDRCGACHTAPNDEIHRNPNLNCGQCHGQHAWKPATFEHDSSFVLDRDHNASCSTCHTDNDYSRYTCYGCHAHRPDVIRAEHLEAGIADFDNCVKCHRSASEEPVESGPREGRERD